MNHHHKLLVLLLVVVGALALPQPQRGSRRFQLSEELPSAPEEWRPERTLRRVDTEQPQPTRRRTSLEPEAEIPSRRQAVPTQRRSPVTRDERAPSPRRTSQRVVASPAPEFETASSVVREQVVSSRTQRRSFNAEDEETIAPRSSFSRRRDSGVHRVTSPSSSEFDTASSVLTPVKQQLVTEQAQRRASYRDQEPEVAPRQISSRRRDDTRGRSKAVPVEPEVRRSGSSSRRGGRRLTEGGSSTTSATPTTTVSTSTISTSVANNPDTTTPTPIIGNQTANDADVAASLLNPDAAHIIDNDIPEASAAPLQISPTEAQGLAATDVLRSRVTNTRQGAARSGSARRKSIGDTDNEIVVRPRGGGNTRRHPEGPSVAPRTRHEPFNDISRTATPPEVDSQSNTQRVNTGRPRSRGEARSSANDDQHSTSRNVRNRNRDTEHSRRPSAEEEAVKTTSPQQEIHRVDKGRRNPVTSRPERVNADERSLASVEVEIPKRNRVRTEPSRGQVLGNDETENSARNNRQSTTENFQRRNGNSSARSGIQTEVTKSFRSRNRSSDSNRRYTEPTNTGTEPESVTISSRTTVLRNKVTESGRGKQRQSGRRGPTSITEGSDYQKAEEDRSQFPSRGSNKPDNSRFEPVSDLKSSGRRKSKESQEEILPSATSDTEGSEILEQLQLQDALKLKDENEAQEQEVQKKGTNGELEDSFITRSSHQVVTVTAFPNSVSNSQQKVVTPPASKQRFFRPGENRRPVYNNKLRTATLSVAPTPASSRDENEGQALEVQKVVVTVSKSESDNTNHNRQRSRNNEDNNVSNVALHRFNARKTSSFNATRIKSAGKHTEREELKAVPTTETKRQLSPPTSPVPQINPTVSHVGRTGIYLKQQHSQKAAENVNNFSKISPFASTTSLPSTKVSVAETRIRPSERLQELTQREPTSSTRKGAALATTSAPADTKKVATSYVSVVMSNGAPAKPPRFSARYRSELFRATGHGSRVTTTPVYVPTVPTVRTSPLPTSSFTSHTSEPVLSETPSGVPKVVETSQQRESTVHAQADLNTTTAPFSTFSTTTEITTSQSITKRKPADIVTNADATTTPSNDYKQNLTLPTDKKSGAQPSTVTLTNKPTNTKIIPLPSRTFISASRRQSGPFVETADNINRNPAKQVEIIYKPSTTTSKSPDLVNPKVINERADSTTAPTGKKTSQPTTDRAKPKAKPKRPNEDRWFPNLVDLFFPSSTRASPITIDLLDEADGNANRVVRVRDVKSSTPSSTTTSTTTVDSFIQRIPPKSKAAEDNEIRETFPSITTTTASSTTTTPTTTTPTTTTTTATTTTLATPVPNIPIQAVPQGSFVPPRIYTTTLRTPVPFVVFGIYPNGTIFRKLPNSDIKEIVHENEIGRKNPYYLDQDITTTTAAPTRTTESPLKLNIVNNEILPAVRTTSTVTTPQLANTAADIQSQINLPVELNTVVPYEPIVASPSTAATLVATQVRNMTVGAMMAEALGLDASANLTEATMASFLANLARNSRIITAPITNTTSSDTTTTSSAVLSTAATTTKPLATTATTTTTTTPATTTTTTTTTTTPPTTTTTTTTTTPATTAAMTTTATTPATTTTTTPATTTTTTTTTTPTTTTSQIPTTTTQKPVLTTSVSALQKRAPATPPSTVTKKPIPSTKKPTVPTTKKPAPTTTTKKPPPTTTKKPASTTVTNKSKPTTTVSPITQKATATEKRAVSITTATPLKLAPSSKNTAAPKTTARPSAGVLDEISFLNALFGQLQNSSPRPERDQGSSLANRIIQAALARGVTTTTKPPAPKKISTTIKPSTAQPSTTTTTSTSTTTTTTTTTSTTTPLPVSTTKRSTTTVTAKPVTPKPANKATGAALQNAEELDALLKLLENVPPATKNLSPSEQLLNDFLIKQATANVPASNLRNPLALQVSPSPSSKPKAAKRPKSIPRSTTQPPGQLLGQLFGPAPDNSGASQPNKIRDPRAGQGLVEAAINATKVMSQIMGSVIRGAARSFQSLFRSLASSSG